MEGLMQKLKVVLDKITTARARVVAASKVNERMRQRNPNLWSMAAHLPNVLFVRCEGIMS